MSHPSTTCHRGDTERRYLRDCLVVSNEPVTPHHFRMRLHGPEIAEAARCGQFCMIEVSKTLYPFLRRPMCFERIHPPTFDILYKVEGEGTRLLQQVAVGQQLSVQGPLGRGFPIGISFRRHILVGGGIGIAALPALAEELLRVSHTGIEVILAAKTKEELLCEREFREMGCAVHCVTDDGSAGMCGFASDALHVLQPCADDCIYACGPMPMMKAVARIAESVRAECLVSLEAQMACGDGACLGCVVQAKEEREGERMVRVCLDGPVFDARVIDWEAIQGDEPS